MSGMFVTFEGGEGVGKSTQIARLVSVLEREGQTVVTTREPGGSSGAEAVRHVLLSGAASAFGPNLEAVLFAAARSDNVENIIRPARDAGHTVICDRYLDSSSVYQGAGSKADGAFVADLQTFVTQGAMPDLTIVLDMPVDRAIERMRARQSENNDDRFEKEDIAVHEKRRQAFLDLAMREPHRIVVVDADRGADSVGGRHCRTCTSARAGLIALEPEFRVVKDRIDGIPVPGERQGVVGHMDVRKELAALAASERIPHALLIGGPRGIGKATLALDFATKILSRRHSDNSTVADQLAAGAHPNFVHVTPPFDTANGKFKDRISIDDIRRTRSFYAMTAGTGGTRICLIDAADDMTPQAANALLKTLEEPPKDSLFLLLSHAPGRLLPTIRSRCRYMSLKPLSHSDLQVVLTGLDIELEANLLERVIALSGGSPRRALQLAQTDVLKSWTAFEHLTSKAPDWSAAHALADKLSTRTNAAAFVLFVDLLYDWLGRRVRERTDALDVLAGWAIVWERASRTLSKAGEYNLDRRQSLLELFDSIFQTQAR